MRGPLRARPPVVVTVHDLAVLRFPEAFPLWHGRTGSLALRASVRAADAVAAVSSFTRSELAELLGVPGERVRVVPNGVDEIFHPRRPSPPRASRRLPFYGALLLRGQIGRAPSRERVFAPV